MFLCRGWSDLAVSAILSSIFSTREANFTRTQPPMALIAVYDENVATGRIVSTRVEITSVLELMESDSLGPSVHVVHRDSARDEDSGQPAPFLVVERAPESKQTRAKASSAQITVLRFYSLHQAVVEHLLDQNDNSLVEDGEVLRFAVSSCGADAGINPFAVTLQKIRPLEAENALLRAALGFQRREPIDLLAVKKKVSALRAAAVRAVSQSNEAGSFSRTATAHGVEDSKDRIVPATTAATASSSANHPLSASVATAPAATATTTTTAVAADPFSIHAPHLWEMETDAAINARTKYQPYRSHTPAGGRRLDLITQQHLVVRLHDKSIDSLRTRRFGQQKEVDPAEKRILSSEEQQELGTRLHDRQREHTAKVLEELTAKVHGNVSPPRVMTSEELRQSNERIYKEPMEKKRNNLERLLQKYIFDEEEKHQKLKLTLEQQKAMGERLAKK